MVDVTQIEEKAEKIKASTIEVNATLGNLVIGTHTDFDNISLRLARAGPAIPPHCREQPGTVYALCLQALEWRMPIMSVINKSYVVNNHGVQRIAYESQLIHAIIERNAPLRGRLRYVIIGEDDDRRCKVWGTFKGEEEPHVYHSEKLSKLRDARGRNEFGVLKGSPLWDHQPEVQLFYSATRTWARMFCPDVILGAYTPEDPQYATVDVTPAETEAPLVQRLRAANKPPGSRGLDVAHVERETSRHTIIEGEANPGTAEQEADYERTERSVSVAGDEGRDDETADRADGNLDTGGRDAGVDADQAAGEASVEQQAITPAESREAHRKPKAQGKRK